MEKISVKSEIVEKGFIVWHDGMLSSNPNEGYLFENLPVTYAESPSKAKSKASELYDFEIDGDTHTYTDIKVRRAKWADWIKLDDGEKVIRTTLERKLKEDKKVSERRAKVEAYPDNAMFYIQNGYVGNAVLWWGLNSSGYVCDILKAQRYTKEYVLKHFCDGREEDIIWEANHVLECTKLIVDGQFLKKEFKS